ncbi:hypothetical protein BDZ45DRAFT_26390 [Acephala macrosclerotiorum]|nr:hypothetical protein BDZ45DRAFT_26390 [Acephala macrosclerotiorum]
MAKKKKNIIWCKGELNRGEENTNERHRRIHPKWEEKYAKESQLPPRTLHVLFSKVRRRKESSQLQKISRSTRTLPSTHPNLSLLDPHHPTALSLLYQISDLKIQSKQPLPTSSIYTQEIRRSSRPLQLSPSATCDTLDHTSTAAPHAEDAPRQFPSSHPARKKPWTNPPITHLRLTPISHSLLCIFFRFPCRDANLLPSA